MKNIITLPRPVYIISSATVAGEEEFNGPLGESFDFHSVDEDTFGCDTWEKSESEMQKRALTMALSKAGLGNDRIDCIFAGDLINQCSASNYGLLSFDLPFLGIYGACSTAAEGLLLASSVCSSGLGGYAAAVTSSHNASAERQFRFPLEYGAQRCPTCQWTVTGSGAFIVSAEKADSCPAVTDILIGRAVDAGINDVNNMGAAMAPAAYDTLATFFRDTKSKPSDYDLVITGDLGELGHAIVRDFFARDGIQLGENFQDCGLLLYDRDQQDMHAGASGCGCSASVLNGYLLTEMRRGKWKKIVFAPTGALLSPTSSFQGESVPGICHVVCLSVEK